MRQPIVRQQERQYPHSIDAERQMLGAILVNPRSIDDLPSAFRAEQFYRDDHAVIFRAIAAVRTRGDAINSFSVEAELKRVGRFDQLGGVEMLHDLMEASVFGLDAPYLAELIRTYAIYREQIRVGIELIDAGFLAAEHPGVAAEKAINELVGLIDADAAESVQTMAQVIDLVIPALERRKAGEMDGLATGFNSLDRLIGGLVSGRMIILAARPAMGKTAIALNIATHVATTGARVLFVSQEMGHAELAERMISSRSQVASNRIRDAAFLDKPTWDFVIEAARSLAPLTLTIDDTPGRTAVQVSSLAARMKARDDIHLIVVDYIQLLESESGSRSNRQEAVASISRRLKRLAQELNCPVLVLSQLNRGVESREDKRPRMGDLRESGALEQDADQVMLLHRPSYYDPNDQPGIAELIIDKNRHGATGVVKLVFEGSTTTFRPIDNRTHESSTF